MFSYNNKMKKRAISPVIATVLLIAIVVILALIIFLWARSFIGETIRKSNMPADKACELINLQVSYSGNSLDVINQGNVPLYRMEVRKISGGSIEKETINERLSAGNAISKEIGEGYDSIEVLPVILGQTQTSKKSYTCKNKFASG